MPQRAERGATYIDKANGYVMECVRGHELPFTRDWVAQHIVRMCEKLGRLLHYGEIVHHRNHNKQDNRLRNLKLTTRQKHPTEHRGAKRTEETKKRLSESAKKRCTPAWRREVSARVKKQHKDGKFGRQTWKEK